MLGRPNPYRKTRQAGTLDDLMFDMDKRRHTSFRFQNYQNFITDRPGKFDERYRQKLSWCALDEETGQLDYLTEGLSPTAAGRRASTSSVGSKTTTGDRDSLLPGGVQESSSSSSANLGAGGVGEEDLMPTPLNLGREDSSGGLTPPRRRSLTPTGFVSPIASFEGAATVKPSSGRSWVAPQFVIDPENRAPNVLLEDAPARDDHFPFSAAEDGIPIGDTRDGARVIVPSDAAAAPGAAPGGGVITLSPTRSNRLRVQTVFGQSPASRSTGSSGRRSSNSAYSFGTSPTRGGGGGGSWARRSGGGSNSNSSSTGSRVSGGANVVGRGATNDITAVVRTIKPGHGGGGEGGEVERQDEGEESSPEASAIAGGGAGEVDNAGAVQGVEEGNPGREPSYGTVSQQAFVSTATSTERGGSLMASNVGEEGAIPRRSEVSTYFSSIASVVGGADPIEGLVMTSGGTPEGLYTPEKGPSEGKEKRGDVDFVVVSASDPGLLVRPPRVGDGKLEHDKERRLGVAGDLEAVIAELSRRKNSLAWEDGEGACPGAGVRSPGGTGIEEEEELRQTARSASLRPEGADEIDQYGTAGAPTTAEAAATAVDEKKKSCSAPAESISPPTNAETLASSSPKPPTASACVTETTEAVNASTPATLADAPEAQAPAVILAVPEPLSSKVDSTPLKDREPPALRVKGKEAGGNAAGSGAVMDRVEYPRSPATVATSTVTAAAAIAAANASSPRIAARARASSAALAMKAKARASHAASGTQAAGAPVFKGLRGPGKMSMPMGGASDTSALRVKCSAVAAATAARAAAPPPPKLAKSAKPRSPRARYDAPTASSAAKAYSGGAGASSGKGSGGRGETITHHRREQKGQRELARGKEEGDKAQGKTASRRKPSLRRSMSAPPAGYGEEDEVGVDEMVADIVTPSDMVTSVQALADGAAPLSGVPGDDYPAFGGEHQPLPNVPDSDHRRTVPSACARAKIDATQGTAMSTEQERTDAALTLSSVVVKPPQFSTNDDERSSRRPSGVNGVIHGGEGGGGRSAARGKSTVDRRSMAASSPVPPPSGGGSGTPGATRKGKYQVKNSFNRLKGWIHGGFTGGSGRKNNGFGGTGGGSSRSAAARGSTTRAQAGSKASVEGSGAPSVGSVSTAATKPEGSKNFKFNAAANRAATRVAEARKRSVERESARAARHTGSSRARQGSTGRYTTNKTATPSPRSQGQRLGTARDQSLSRTGPRPAPASSDLENDKVNPDELAPTAVVALIQDRGRTLERPLQAASAGSSPSPSPSPPSSPSHRAGVKTEAVGVAPDGCRVPSSTSATPSVAGRVAAPAPPVSARAKTAKAARSLGVTVPPHSGACRAASNTPRTAGGGGGSGFRRTVESPRLLKSPSANVRSRYPEDYGFTNGARGRDSVVTVGGGTGVSGARSQKGRKSVRGGGDSIAAGGSMRRTPKGDKSGKPGRVG